MFSKILSVLAVALFATIGSAQDGHFTYGTDYGFTYKATVTNNHTFTNDNAYPWKLNSLSFPTDNANTATVKLVKVVKVYQEVGDVVTTNLMGGVETNYSHAVTNTLITYFTNVLLSVTNSGGEIYDSGDIPQTYIQLGDIITWTFSDNTSKLLYFDALR